MEWLIVIGRLLFSAFANVFQKQLAHRGLHPFFIVFASYLILGVICFPLLWTFNSFALSHEFWLAIFFAALLDMAGTLFLVLSLSQTDLSIFGPLNAYKVVISMLLAMVFLNEVPTLQGFMGVFIIVLGSYLLFPAKTDHQGGRLLQLFRQRGVQYRFLSILLFSVGTLPLKTAVMTGGPLATTVYWCLLGLPMAGIAQKLFVRNDFAADIAQLRADIYPFMYLGCLIFLMQLMTMLVFAQLYVAYSLALFQLSMVLQVFLGYRIFNEPHFLRRLTACLVMVAGSLIVMSA